jgi:isopenicillin N synthase-like dioxygenase
MAGKIEAKLAALGITLPTPAAPIANYIPFNISGKLVVISGQVPVRDGKIAYTGKLGAGAHADWGAFTILATDATPGLQVTMGEGVWLPVPPRKGCLIINSGDQIAQLSNDAYRSAVHRVVTVSTTPRFSTAVFTYFNLEAEVAPLPRFVSAERGPRYPAGRTTRQYFHFKLGESMERGGGYAPPAAQAGA